jgi:hypothetical protein
MQAMVLLFTIFMNYQNQNSLRTDGDFCRQKKDTEISPKI